MKVAILSSSLSRKGGGVSEVALRLSQNLLKLPGVDVQAFGLRDDRVEDDKNLWYPIRINVTEVIGPDFFGYSPTLLSSLKNSGADLIHLHGIWQYPSLACAKARIPYITTIHGMLDQWAIKNSGLKKQIAAFFYEKAALKKAKCLQAFTMQEYMDIRNFGLKNPVCIIPNGVDIPVDTSHFKATPPVWNKIGSPGYKTLLYLGRIHPKKGLTNLIKAWKNIHKSKAAANWQLVIAGWDQHGYENELKELAKRLEIIQSIHFVGPQFTDEKKLTFFHADAFILPSFSEGLPMAVLEAWSYGLPVIMTKHCNLPEGFASNAALEITTEVESISEGLFTFFSKSEEALIEMGKNGNLLVREKFSWESVATKLREVYQWVITNDKKPESIIFD